MNNYNIYPHFCASQLECYCFNAVAPVPAVYVTPAELLMSVLTLGIVAPQYNVVYKDLVARILALPSVHAKMERVKPNGFRFNFNHRLCMNILALLLELGVLDPKVSNTRLGRMVTGRRCQDTISYNEPRFYPTELNDQIIADIKQLIASLW